MKGLELLNTMALLDGEREFLDNDFSGDIDVSFESGEKAREAFEYTSSIRAALKVQAEESNIPAAWTEMINAHPETQPVTMANRPRSVFASFLASFTEHKGAWSGGVVTACLVLVLINPLDDIDTSANVGGALGAGALISSTDNADKVMQPASNPARLNDPFETPDLMSEIRQTQEDNCESDSEDDLDASAPPSDKDACPGDVPK